MATATVQLALNKSAYTDASQPNTVIPTNTYTQYPISRLASSDYHTMYFGFDAMPDALKRKALISAQLMAYIRIGYGSSLWARVCDGSFDPAEVTYNNPPELVQQAVLGTYPARAWTDPATWADRLSNLHDGSTKGASKEAYTFLSNLGLELVDTFSSDAATAWYIKTVLANGSTPPYILVTYDPDLDLTSKVANLQSDRFGAAFNAAYDTTFTWDLVVDSNTYHCSSEVWEQASAVFYWKYSNQVNWNQIAVTGSAQTITVPKNTWTNGKTVQVYVSVTDTEGTTTQSAVISATAVTTKLTVIAGPTSGYADPREAINFRGEFAYTALGYTNYVMGTYSLFWKAAEDEDYTEIPSLSAFEAHIIPANTFPTGTSITWYMSGSDTTGCASSTIHYTFSTSAGTAYTFAAAPINTVEDGSGPITFRWLLASSDGQAPTAVDLWWKLPSETSQEFHTLLDHATAVTSYDVPAGTFPAGEIQWIVRAYNIDDTAGPWSRPTATTYYSFICLSAPDPVEGLSTDNAPFVTVSWQSSEQQAYEIQIDGKVVQKGFGPDINSWTSPDYLEDGAHEITVRVQGQYGLWSQPATAYCNIQNQPLYSLALEGEFGTDAILTATTAPGYMPIDSSTVTTGYRIRVSSKALVSNNLCYVSDFIPVEPGQTLYFSWILDSNSYGHCWYDSSKTASEAFASSRANRTVTVPDGIAYIRVTGYLTGLNSDYITVTPPDSFAFGVLNFYRDDIRIGQTSGSSFTDRFVLGEHSYFALAKLADGNYTKSNTVTGLLSVESSMIAEFGSQDAAWLSLQLTERSNGIQSFQKARTNSIRHFSGAEYPVIELSPYSDLSGQYDTAFPAGDPRSTALEALYGKQVILKSRRGNVVIGVLTQLQKNVLLFYDSYSFTLRQIHWEDFIDDTSD